MAYSKSLPTANFTVDDDFQTTLSSSVTASTTAIPLSSLPTATEGTLVIEPDTDNEEEIYYTSLGSGVVNCPSAANGRGINGTTAITHNSGVTVKMIPTRAHYEALKAGGAIDDDAIRSRHIHETTLGAGWIDASDRTWTYASASTFTVAADITGVIGPGDKLRLKQGGGYKYFFVQSASYSNPNTTVTVKDGIDGATYTLANATITDNYYSKATYPNGFPTNATYLDKVSLSNAFDFAGGTSDVSFADATDTLVGWNTEVKDTNGLFSTSARDRVTIQQTGWYIINAAIGFASNGTGDRRVWVRKNGSTTNLINTEVRAASTGSVSYGCTGVVYLAAADVLYLYALQNSGGALDLDNTNASAKMCRFEVIQIA